MAANYIANADINGLIGTARRELLFTEPGGSYSATEQTRCVEIASAIVKSNAHNAGYTGLGDTTTNDQIVALSLRLFLELAYARKGEKVPEGLVTNFPTLDDLRTGKLGLTGLAPAERDAVGGSYFSESSTSVTDASVQVFTRAEQNRY